MLAFDITSTGHRLADTMLNGGSSVSYREVRASSLPVFVKAWFHMGVESRYAQEYKWRTENPHFNFKDKQVLPVLSQYDDSVKDTTVFVRDDCLKIIEGALTHEWDYFHDPIHALTRLLFRKREVVDGIHLVDFLTQFQREPYYTEAVKKYVLEHEDTRLDQELFEQFLTNAEREFLLDQPVEAVRLGVMAVAQIMELINQNGSSDHISLIALDAFVKARGLDQSLPRLNDLIVSLQAEEASFVTIESLVEALTDEEAQDSQIEETLPEHPPNELPDEMVTEQPDEDLQSDVIPIDNASDGLQEDSESDESTASIAMPADEFIDQESEMPSTFAPPPDHSTFAPPPDPYAEAVEPIPPADPSPTEPVAPDRMDENTAETKAPVSSMNFADEIDDTTQTDETDDEMMDETISNTVTPPLKAAVQIPSVEISDKLRKMFIKKLFNKDEGAYQNTLDLLEPALSWEETFSIIEEIWQDKGLNLFSKESQEFTRVFYERYFPPS